MPDIAPAFRDRIKHLKAPRPDDGSDTSKIAATVKEVLDAVRTRGDDAVRHYSREFDKAELTSIEVTDAERAAALAALDPQTRADTEFAIERVRAFAEAQLKTILPLEIEALPGLHLGHRVIPVQRVGAYVPGGRYPLLSAPVMTLVPAKVAGCEEVIACLPPGAHPAMIAGCHLSGADRIFRVGGAQAIAAMAFGTQTIPAVDKVVGPGNAYVNEAKRQVFGPVGIDQLAGPSEIFIVADETGDAEMIATDLLAQAEHDVRTRVGLITTSRALAEATLAEVERQLDGPLHRSGRRRGVGTVRRDRGLRRRGGDDRLFRPHRRRASAGAHTRCARHGGKAAQLRLAVHRHAGERGLFRQMLRHQPHAADHGRGALHRRAVGRLLRQDLHAPMAG